jgi:hypothetical protein
VLDYVVSAIADSVLVALGTRPGETSRTRRVFVAVLAIIGISAALGLIGVVLIILL